MPWWHVTFQEKESEFCLKQQEAQTPPSIQWDDPRKKDIQTSKNSNVVMVLKDHKIGNCSSSSYTSIFLNTNSLVCMGMFFVFSFFLSQQSVACSRFQVWQPTIQLFWLSTVSLHSSADGLISALAYHLCWKLFWYQTSLSRLRGRLWYVPQQSVLPGVCRSHGMDISPPWPTHIAGSTLMYQF